MANVALSRSMPCEHKVQIGCVLTALSICCACADKRPMAPAYPVYVDGEGMKVQGKRWARYCWKCRDFWNFTETQPSQPHLIPETSTTPDTTMSQQSRPRQQLHQFSPRARPSGPVALPASSNNRLHQSDHQPQPLRVYPVSYVAPIPVAQRVNNHNTEHNPHSHPPVTTQTQQPRPQVFPLGTREDVERDDYQSPVGLLFQRAYDRYRTAEEVRQETAAHLGIPVGMIQTMDPFSEYAGFADSQVQPRHQHGYVGVGDMLYPGTAIQLGYHTSDLPGAPPQVPVHYELAAADDDGNGDNAVDRQQTRPEPLKTEDMTIGIACKMCLEQKIDTLIEPCMHLAMCRWCSEVWKSNATRLRRRDPNLMQSWKCPVCRKGIQQVRRVYF